MNSLSVVGVIFIRLFGTGYPELEHIYQLFRDEEKLRCQLYRSTELNADRQRSFHFRLRVAHRSSNRGKHHGFTG